MIHFSRNSLSLYFLSILSSENHLLISVYFYLCHSSSMRDFPWDYQRVHCRHTSLNKLPSIDFQPFFLLKEGKKPFTLGDFCLCHISVVHGTFVQSPSKGWSVLTFFYYFVSYNMFTALSCPDLPLFYQQLLWLQQQLVHLSFFLFSHNNS